MSVFYSTDYNPGYPFYYYNYDATGIMGTEENIENEADLVKVFDHEIPRAIQEKRRFIICDCFGYCLLHAEDGKIIFPTKEHITNPGDIFTVRNNIICRI